MGVPVLARAPGEVFVSCAAADERWATWIAAQLERERYRVLVEAWDRTPGEDVESFVRRAVSTTALTVVVWSHAFVASRVGMTLATTSGRRGAPLMVVRVDDAPAEPARLGAAELDLGPFAAGDAEAARAALLDRVATSGVAPPAVTEPAGGAVRRFRVPEPRFPPAYAAQQRRADALTVLHVAGPRFESPAPGAGEPQVAADELRERIVGSVAGLCSGERVGAPDLVAVSGDLMSSGTLRQKERAEAFLTGLRVGLDLTPDRLVVVPGAGDVSPELCRAYLARCRAYDQEPQRPYIEKLDHFADLFRLLYGELPDPGFTPATPWTLFELPELRLVVAGLNSTMAISDRAEDDYGEIGEAQAGWFAERLATYERRGWLRIGLMGHDPVPARGDEQDRTALHDVETLRRVLGGRLNLLLHGPGTGGTDLARLGATMHVLPAEAPGRFELVRIAGDGLTRYSPGDPDGQHSRVAWAAAESTFRPEERDEPAPTIEILEPVLDPARQLLRRVEEVVRARYERPMVYQSRRDPPYLRLVIHDQDVVSLRQVGAHVGELTERIVDSFVPTDDKYSGELVYTDAEPAPALREYARRRGVPLKSFIEFQGMVDLSGYLARQSERLRADRRYPADLYIPQRYRARNGHITRPQPDLAEQLMSMLAADEEGCFVLLLGDFGRGKSFVLREVTRRITERDRHVMPVLVDLRAVDKATNMRTLLAAHLATHDESAINFTAFEYMLREGRIVLLFDGFDELVARLTYDRALEHLRGLAAAARDRAKIVVACRTQHFSSHQEVFDTLAAQVGDRSQWCVLEVERFTPDQVYGYLLNRYHQDDEQARARYELISRVGGGELVELAQNPRMLSFVAELDTGQLRAAATESKVLSAARLFERVLTSWLEYEVQRTAGQPGTPTTLLLDDLWLAVRTLAMRLWRAGESQVRLAELGEVAEALSDLAGGRLSVAQTVHAMGSGSLLVRTDEDLFGFIHRSVVDWLVARVIADELAAGIGRPTALAERELSEIAADFLCDLAPAGACLRWAERLDTARSVGEIERRNADAVTGRLRTPPGADLRGAALAREELSYRRFDGVDLSGADLRGARLVGANLSGAVLHDARLDGAQLDEADLRGADLRGAELANASLFGVDLTGIRIDGSGWRRAAIVNGRGVPADAPELHGAAIAPGMAVVPELPPASIGVRYGFHGTLGRLPEVLAYSPAGDLVAVGGQDGGVLICDSAAGRAVRTLTGHRARVFAVAWGRRWLVTGSRDGTVRIWDGDTGGPVHTLPGHAKWTWPLLLDADGRQVVVGDADGVLRVWDLDDGALRHTLPAGRDLAYSAVRCGGLVAVAYRGGGVLLWDTARGERAGELATGPGPVYRVAADPAGTLLATASDTGGVTVWDAASRRELWRTDGLDGRVYALAFHPDRPRLAAGDVRGAVDVWDTGTRSLVHRCTQHGATVYAVAFSSRGELATGDRAGTLLLRDGTTGTVRRRLVGHTGSVWPFAFRPDGGQLAVSDDQDTLRLWDPETGERHELTGHAREVYSVRFSPGGGSLAVTRNDGAVRIWDPVGGRMQARLGGGLERLQWATFDPAGERLVTVTNDRLLHLWNLATGEVERAIDVESAAVWAVAFSPSGKVVASANDDDTVRLWWAATGRLMHVLRPHKGRVRSIAFSPDGTLVATGCDDSLVRLWEARTGQLVGEPLARHGDRVYAVEFGDGCLASASWDGTAVIWGVGADPSSREFAGHTARLWTATFAADGRTLATAGDDLAIRLWDVRDGSTRHVLDGHTDSVRSLSFSPDGRLLASGGADGVTRLWRMGESPEERPVAALTLLGLAEGWAAAAPDGRYRLHGNVDEAFWYVVGLRRFEVGELDEQLPTVTRLTGDTTF